MNPNRDEVVVSGGFGLSAAAAVATPIVGDTIPLSGGVTKTGTGTYRVRVPASCVAYHKVHEVTEASVNFFGNAPATALNVRVSAATNESGTGDLLIDIVTGNATYVATDTTAATRILFSLRFKSAPRI